MIKNEKLENFEKKKDLKICSIYSKENGEEII